jgi:hypothetical protein
MTLSCRRVSRVRLSRTFYFDETPQLFAMATPTYEEPSKRYDGVNNCHWYFPTFAHHALGIRILLENES